MYNYDCLVFSFFFLWINVWLYVICVTPLDCFVVLLLHMCSVTQFLPHVWLLTLSHVSLKYSSWAPSVSFFQATVILDCIALLFPWWRVMLVMWHTAVTIALYDTWIAFISFFLFYSKYSQTCSLYYEISDIPILKYVQVNVFGSLDTFIMTVLVDLYLVMGAAMFVRAESKPGD